MLLLAFVSDELFGDKLHINVIGELFLPLRVRADAVLNAHPVYSVGVSRVDLAHREIPHFLQQFVFPREGPVYLMADAIERLIVVQP